MRKYAMLLCACLLGLVFAAAASADPTGSKNAFTAWATCSNGMSVPIVVNNANGQGAGAQDKTTAEWAPAHVVGSTAVFHPTVFDLTFTFTPAGGTPESFPSRTRGRSARPRSRARSTGRRAIRPVTHSFSPAQCRAGSASRARLKVLRGAAGKRLAALRGLSWVLELGGKGSRDSARCGIARPPGTSFHSAVPKCFLGSGRLTRFASGGTPVSAFLRYPRRALKRTVCASLVVVAALGALLASQAIPAATPAASRARVALSERALRGIHKIKHVVIIMQENRSFDSYFGTYPGADGIPGLAGHPGKVPCLPDPGKHCVRPYHDTFATNFGGPHTHGNVVADIAGGRMNGFVVQEQHAEARLCQQFAAPCVLHGPPEDARRDGVSRRARDPELLELRQQLRAPGPHVRVRRVLEHAGASVSRLRLVGVLCQESRPDELPERGGESRLSPAQPRQTDRHRA